MRIAASSDPAAWLTGWATLALAVATALLALFAFLAARWAKAAAKDARKLYDVEVARDAVADGERADRQAARDREQAGRVSAWFASEPVYDNDDADVLMYWKAGAYVLNASELPVYKVVVGFMPVDSGLEAAELPLGDALPPGPIPQWVGKGQYKGDFQVWVAFTDAAGQRWERRHDGLLRTVPGAAEVVGRGTVAAGGTVITPEASP